MSKVTKRKITVESPGNKLNNSNTLSNSSNKDSQRRQSVFERLGTKTGASISINTALVGQQPTSEGFCRHWNQNGTCPYGKNCVFVSTHTLISPSKRVPKKDLDPKQILARSLEEGLKLEGLKRLHSTVVKCGSPDLNWESWDQTDLEYEDEKVLEKRRQLLQRELELQMKREETEEHHSRRRHTNTKQKKGLSSSSSTSVSSTSSESSSSSDDSSSDSSSTSGVTGDAKRRRSKTKKTKRGSTSSISDSERKKIRDSTKSMHKDRSPSNISRKSTGSRDKRAFTPPRKSAPTVKMAARKKSPSPSHRRHNTPTGSSKNKPSTSKSSSGSRHNQSPRPSNKRSTSLERGKLDKHKRSLSPRPPRSVKPAPKERSPPPPPRRQESAPRPRRKDSPDVKPRNNSRSRPPDSSSRNDDRKKEDDRSRNKDDRRPDRKPVSDRDKRDHEDNRAREKAREAAREKEREEALERCRERQREREQLAKEKERSRERPREDRDKDTTKQRDYEKIIPPLMSLSTHSQPDRKISERERDRPIKDRKDREKERDKDKDRDRDRLYDRSLDKSDRGRPLEKERLSEKMTERDRASEKDRPRERENLNERSRDKGDRDRSFERDRNFDRGPGDPVERSFERDKERPSKGLERNRDRDFDRDKERNYERVPDNRRSFEKAVERDRTSIEKDRGIIRDRGLERVLEIRERNKSLERGGRASDGERSVDRNRERFDREGRFDRRALPAEEKGYESPYESRRERPRYGADGAERVGLFKDHSPSREDGRGMRHSQGFSDDRRGRGGREVRGAGGWEGRGGYEDAGPTKNRDWDYPDSRREWEPRNRHGDWEGGVEGEEWGRYGGGGSEWGGGDWREEWQPRPPRHQPREDQTIVSSNHIVVRDANIEETGGRRPQVLESSEKDPGGGVDFKKDAGESGGTVPETSLKRGREEIDSGVGGETKKPRLEEPPPVAMLEEALSDISDDPDEILNREDIDITPQDSAMMEEDVRSSASLHASTQELDQRVLEDRPSEEENIDNLDFEEISDEELEEEARANKGLGDALGVDWASLVCEERPAKGAGAEPGAARRRWQPHNILARVGVSLQYAGAEVFQQIHDKLTQSSEDSTETAEKAGLLHPVAALHVSLRERQARRKCLFSGADKFKRALSARADIAIRRQLCNLPVASLEKQQSSGFCQWVV